MGFHIYDKYINDKNLNIKEKVLMSFLKTSIAMCGEPVELTEHYIAESTGLHILCVKRLLSKLSKEKYFAFDFNYDKKNNIELAEDYNFVQLPHKEIFLLYGIRGE